MVMPLLDMDLLHSLIACKQTLSGKMVIKPMLQIT